MEGTARLLIVEISDASDRGRVVGKAVVTAPSPLAALSLVADGDPVVEWTIPLPR
jgi:hypothetical protein